MNMRISMNGDTDVTMRINDALVKQADKYTDESNEINSDGKFLERSVKMQNSYKLHKSTQGLIWNRYTKTMKNSNL